MKRILLIEDNDHIMKINAGYLTGCGYLVEKAYTLGEAEKCLRRPTPDLIVLDVMMPDGDGLEFCERILKIQDIPVLFLTARISGQDVAEGFRRGGKDYLKKPYELEELGARIHNLIGASEEPARYAHRVMIGPVTFDFLIPQAYVNEVSLNLTRKEFSVLYLLAESRGSQVSGEELIGKVWEQERETDRAALWSTVSRLKKKIVPYEHLFYIESDHCGYELVMIAG